MVVVAISMLYWLQQSRDHFSLAEVAHLAFFRRSKPSAMDSWQLLSRQDQNRNLPRVDSGDGCLSVKEMLKQVSRSFLKKTSGDSGSSHSNLASRRKSSIIA